MGFFIRDLYREIERLHAQQFGDTHETLFTVYRGQGLSNLDFEKLKKTKGNLMSFNNFLSTSKDRAISLKFAEDALTKPGMVGILFKMIIDPSNASMPFACINNVSNIKDEGEILFSIGSVYRISEVEKIDDNDRLYQVELKLTSSSDQELHVLVNRIEEETYPATAGWHRMGMLLIKLHQYSKAKELYETVLQQTTDEQQKGHLYHMLGVINNGQGNYTEAIEFFENSIKTNQTTHPLSLSDLAASYNNIGLVYDNMEDYSKALAFYEKALEIGQKTLRSDHPHLANSYDNVGGLYCKIGDYPKVLSFFEKTLVIRQKILPPNHPELATSYNNIGLVYENMGEQSKALVFHEQALAIQQQSLPSNHPHLVSSYDNIGLIYNNMGQYSNALSYYQKALDIMRRILPENHLYLATCYACHGSVYNKMGEYLKALLSHEKALEI
jgi:tetratricopeptide (TPR) repeat protein